jgi:hypothetical protein
VLATSSGRLLGQAVETGAGEGVIFDVFGPDGQTRGQLALPPGSRVTDFGEEGLFVARSDELGLQWLGLYIPAFATGISTRVFSHSITR